MRSPDNCALRNILIGDYSKRFYTEPADDVETVVVTWITRLPSGVFGRLDDVVENENGDINATIAANDFNGTMINGVWQ